MTNDLLTITTNLLNVLKSEPKLLEHIENFAQILYTSPEDDEPLDIFIKKHPLNIVDKNFDYIVFEGCDFSGKSYLIENLVIYDYFKEYDNIIVTSAPYCTFSENLYNNIHKNNNKFKYLINPVRPIISSLIKSRDTSHLVRYLLFLVDELILINDLINLKTGDKKVLVVQDRRDYISSLCYQRLYLKGLYTDKYMLERLIKHHYYLYNKYPVIFPDIIIHVKASIDTILSRAEIRKKDDLDGMFLSDVETIKRYYDEIFSNGDTCPLLKQSGIIEIINDTDNCSERQLDAIVTTIKLFLSEDF